MTRRTLSLFALVAAAAFGACYNEDAPLSPHHGLQTKILLTDAPFPYDSVSRVDIYIVSIEASTGTDTTDSAGSNTEWVTVTEPKRRFNLLELQHGTAADLGGDLLPAGRYRSLKMIIDGDSSSITSKAGTPMAVNWGWTTRPKLYALVEAVNEVSDQNANIVIDFDVGRSFWPMSSGEFLFLPVMRAVNEAATGAIDGTVRGDSLAINPAPIRDVTITVYTGNVASGEDTWAVRATGRTDDQGHFRIAYLLPGTYIVRSDAPRASPYSPGVRSNVTVVKQTSTDSVDITLPRRSASSVTITPTSRQIAVGAQDTLLAYATDTIGQAIIAPEFTWTSSAPGIASIEVWAPNYPWVGRVRGIAEGVAIIQACYGGQCATSTITVGAAPPTTSVASVTISPPSLNMLVGDSVSFGATLRDSAGRTLNNRAIAWYTPDSTIVRVFGYGSSAVVRAVKAGTATVRASAEGKTGSASVVVLAP